MKAPLRIVVLIAVAALAIAYPLFVGPYFQSIALMVLIYVSLAVSWDMLLRSGQISFGMAGFFGLGAYGSALTTLNLGLPPILSILFGGVVAVVIALVLALLVLRLRGMYFAIVTLALAEIFRVIIRNWSSLSGGPEGRALQSVIFGGNSVYLYWLVLAVAFLTILASELFMRTRIRFALTTTRNNEVVAQSRGVDIFKYLALAFVITAGLQGIAGGAYAQVYGFVTPDESFSVDFTLLPLAMALLGGIYGTLGPVVGAVVLGVIAEYLKLYIPYGHELVYGLIIIVVILFMPRGLAVVLRKKLLGGST